MSEERAVTWACEADRRRRRLADRKHAVAMWWHGVFWRALQLTRLARPYSKAMCWANLYRRFSDGRCMWCGFVHHGTASVSKNPVTNEAPKRNISGADVTSQQGREVSKPGDKP